MGCWSRLLTSERPRWCSSKCNSNHEGFYLRFFSELLLYLRQYQPLHPWHAIVLYPNLTIERLNQLNRPLLALSNLHRIVLTELPLLASPNPKLWLIALILAEEPKVAEIVSRVQTYRRQHPSDGIDWLELLETVLVYKLPHFTREEIQKMVGINDIELRQTRFYQQAVNEGEAILLLRQLERRFGPLSADARRRIAEADSGTLLVWGERVLEAKTLAEIWGG